MTIRRIDGYEPYIPREGELAANDVDPVTKEKLRALLMKMMADRMGIPDDGYQFEESG